MGTISARNQISGVIKSLSKGMVNAEVIIETDSGSEISSIITLGSCVRMNLEPGDKITAIIKASAVLVAVGDSFIVSARNNLQGIVKKIISGSVNDEVVVESGGIELVSIITKASVERMDLKEGMAVSALIKASNVLLMK